MTNARRALRLVNEIDDPELLKGAIDWSINMLRNDLSAFSANKEFPKTDNQSNER